MPIREPQCQRGSDPSVAHRDRQLESSHARAAPSAHHPHPVLWAIAQKPPPTPPASANWQHVQTIAAGHLHSCELPSRQRPQQPPALHPQGDRRRHPPRTEITALGSPTAAAQRSPGPASARAPWSAASKASTTTTSPCAAPSPSSASSPASSPARPPAT